MIVYLLLVILLLFGAALLLINVLHKKTIAQIRNNYEAIRLLVILLRAYEDRKNVY